MPSRSRIIDVLSALRKADKKMGIAHIYLDHNGNNNGELTAETLTAAIVKQLLLLLPDVPQPIIAAYKGFRLHGIAVNSVPLPDVAQMLHLSYEAFDRVYICVDGIDELNKKEAKRLLDTLKGLDSSCSIRLCVTCRDLASSPLGSVLLPAETYQVEIKASEKDIRALLRHYILSRPEEESDAMDEGLEEDIAKRAIALSGGKYDAPTPHEIDQFIYC
jgi:hypothetical protein